MVKRVRNVLAALVSAESVRSLKGLPGWRIHELSGDRKGTWSVSVTGNWRITFEVAGDEIVNLDLEDYH
jgi:proteic killer suppression protein